MSKRLAIIENDAWLEPVEGEIKIRYKQYKDLLADIEASSGSIVDFANGYRYFGFQRDDKNGGWWFREWLPGAKEVYLFGEFNGWDRTSLPMLKDRRTGVWSIFLHDDQYYLPHGSLYKILVVGDNGTHERVPAYAMRAVQDEVTKDFTAQIWMPQPFDWGFDDGFDISQLGTLYIYECHVGMAQEKEGVGSYREFADEILPRIKRMGYNAIQVMGIAEHPYYGSYGYHVSSFFAPSSRFGTPEDLKYMIRRAHELNIAVIMDLVQAHFVKNFNEGLNGIDGTDHCYTFAGDKSYHPYWDSMIFDYGKREVRHFLLSNVKYWLDEFHVDGYRFDGVTSMIYHHHGYTDFDCREKFFNDDVYRDGLTYLTLANTLIHQYHPTAVTIAEDVSGMPGMCRPAEEGGVGFDYRLSMAVPDFWIKMIKDIPDEEWNIWDIWNIMTDRKHDVGTVAYCESHDQAMVGDQTIAFRLMGPAMYDSMDVESKSLVVDRGMALHKMIRLITLTLGGQAYLCFMGNEFGHPEWIDFPREGNDWSYKHARRQWSLVDDKNLRYHQLGEFDREMLRLSQRFDIPAQGYAWRQTMDVDNKIMAYSHGELLFVFNWHPTRSIVDYVVPVPCEGRYATIFSTDEERFGGFGRLTDELPHDSFAKKDEEGNLRHYIHIYSVCRTAMVLKRYDK